MPLGSFDFSSFNRLGDFGEPVDFQGFGLAARGEIIEPLNSFNLGVGAPADTQGPILTGSPSVSPELATNAPVDPPVFFPTVLPVQEAIGTIKVSPISDLPPAETVSLIETGSGVASSFSNVDLGVIAVAFVGVTVTGLFAAFKRKKS